MTLPSVTEIGERAFEGRTVPPFREHGFRVAIVYLCEFDESGLACGVLVYHHRPRGSEGPKSQRKPRGFLRLVAGLGGKRDVPVEPADPPTPRFFS